MKKGLVLYLFLGMALVLGFFGYKVHNRIVNRPPPDWSRNLAEPSPPSGLSWSRCAADGERCEFEGSARVRYGTAPDYSYRSASYFIDCNARAFGAKTDDTRHACDYAPTPPTVAETPNAPSSPVARENRRPGSAGWQLKNPALKGEIEGYASLTSVAPGDSIDFLVHTESPSFDIQVYRMGYYGGLGARLVSEFRKVPGQKQAKPCLRDDGIIECNWKTSHTLAIPDAENGWTSGIYLAKLVNNDEARKDSYILFVVRDDTRNARYVAQLPVTTYQAYNVWGGKSLYTGCPDHDFAWRCPDGSGPSHTVSFNRPYGPGADPLAAYGVGAGEFLTNVQPVAQGYPISSAGFDYNMVRWMERRGYDVEYISNLDLHLRDDVAKQSQAFISMGHDEYYSRDMRDRLIAARDAGVNLAFFSSNQVYWQVRFTEGAYGSRQEPRNMTCYRREPDPVTDPRLTTGTFRSMGEDEARFMGTQYVTDPVMGDVSITNPGHWLFAGSGATLGTQLEGLNGYEINAIIPGVSPTTVVSLARTRFGRHTSDMSYYIAESGAQVFGTGTMQWAWGLDDFISNGVRPDYSSRIAQRITDNVFLALGEQGLQTLQSAANGRFLGPDDATLPLHPVRLTDEAQGLSAQWRLIDAGQGDTRIVARAGGLCLDAFGARDGSSALLRQCDGLPEQRWQVRPAGAGMVSIATGRLCLTAEGTMPALRACSGGAEQRWKQAPAEPTTPGRNGASEV